MPKYHVSILIDASNCLTVEAGTPEEAAGLAYEDEKASPRICRQCSDDVEIGEAISVTVYDESGMTELYNDDYHEKELTDLRTHLTESQQKLEWIHNLIRNDAWAITFQSLGQYRSALLKELNK